MKVLKFREELIELCSKYKCDISGTGRDDGGMYLEFLGDNNLYRMEGNLRKRINYLDIEEKDKYPMEEYIINMFDESNEMAGLNNIKVQCGVFTNDLDKAVAKLVEIKDSFGECQMKKVILSKQHCELELFNGYKYIWINPTDSARGYRCKTAIIDKDITLKQLEITRYICMYCGKDDISMF